MVVGYMSLLKKVDGNKHSPPVDAPIGERVARKPATAMRAPWKTVEALWCAGVPTNELAHEYGVTCDAITYRARKYDWLSPVALNKKAEKLLKKAGLMAADMGIDPSDGEVALPDDPIQALALRMAESGISHQTNMIDEAQRLMEEVRAAEPLKVRSISDLDKLDVMARRNLGLDKEDKREGFVISLTSFDHPPEPFSDEPSIDI